MEWDFDSEKAERWLPAIGCVFHVKVTSHRFGTANDHAGIVSITLVGVGGTAGPSLEEFLRFS